MKFLQQQTDLKGVALKGSPLHYIAEDGKTAVCGVGGNNYAIVEKSKFLQSQLCWNCRNSNKVK